MSSTTSKTLTINQITQHLQPLPSRQPLEHHKQCLPITTHSPYRTPPPPPPSQSSTLTLPPNFHHIDFPIDHMLTHSQPPPPSDTQPTTPPPPRAHMVIPDYATLQEELTMARQTNNADMANLIHRTATPPPPPSSWKPDAEHYDSNPLHGHQFYRQIQPTAWSRKKNIHALDPLTVPAATLMRHGSEDYALRLLSTGRYIGIVPTINIADSVFASMLLKELRDKGLFVDDTARALHQAAGNPVPSKTDDAVQYMQPLIQNLSTHLQSLQPSHQKASQLHQIQELQAQIAKQYEKLRKYGIPSPPPSRRRQSRQAAPPPNPTPPPTVVNSPQNTHQLISRKLLHGHHHNSRHLPHLQHPADRHAAPEPPSRSKKKQTTSQPTPGESPAPSPSLSPPDTPAPAPQPPATPPPDLGSRPASHQPPPFDQPRWQPHRSTSAKMDQPTRRPSIGSPHHRSHKGTDHNWQR